MKLSDIGEDGFISGLLAKHHISDSVDGLPVGAGDDAAVIGSCDDKDFVVITTDMLSENIDYRDDIITPYNLGWKSAAVNLSDIAAMAALPTWALISLGFRPDTELDYIDSFYRGFSDCQKKFGGRIIGGDMNSVIGDNVISITQMGSVESDMLVRRTGAEPGDLILTTGSIGSSRAGFELLRKSGLINSTSRYPDMVDAHIKPIPRINEARILARTRCVKAMMDISDGLGSDLPKLCKANGIGAKIYEDKIFISDNLKIAADELGVDPLFLAVSGGEDFELLFAISPNNADRLFNEYAGKKIANIYIIGEFVKEGISLILSDGSGREIIKGWEHFS